MKDKAVEYELYIDQLVAENQIRADEILFTKNSDSITVEDFIIKTKNMPPWHRRLLRNLTEIQRIHGDIVAYMRKYVEEKVDDGFKFKGQEMGR